MAISFPNGSYFSVDHRRESVRNIIIMASPVQEIDIYTLIKEINYNHMSMEAMMHPRMKIAHATGKAHVSPCQEFHFSTVFTNIGVIQDLQQYHTDVPGEHFVTKSFS